MILNLRFEPSPPDDDGKRLPPRAGLRRAGPVVMATIMPLKGPVVDGAGEATRGPALIDTGANVTCIDSEAAQKSGLTIVGSGKISSATHADEIVPIFAGKLDINGFGTVTLRQAYGANLAAQNINALVGRDLLETMVLIYNGVEGTFSIAR